MAASAIEKYVFMVGVKVAPSARICTGFWMRFLPDNLLPEDMDESWLSKRRARQGKDSALTLEIGFGGGRVSGKPGSRSARGFVYRGRAFY